MASRLFFAGWVSFLGFAATLYWYHASAPKQRVRRNATPIAYLDSSPSDVQRKPTDHLLWEEVKQGEVLFTRDTIRASGKSGARIRMDESGTMIELEPDSVIVLEQNQGKISLNLVNGGLFVKNAEGKTASKSGLEIKVGGTKLAAGAKGLEMNIHRSQSGEANIAVSKGSVKAEAGGKTIDVAQGKSGTLDATKGLDTGKQLQALAPAANGTLESVGNDATVAFRWTPIGTDFDVWLEMGDKPGQLSPRTGKVSGDAGAIAAKIASGEHYWRLAAAKHGEAGVAKASSAVRLTVVSLQPPEPVLPAAGAHIANSEGGTPVKFNWAGNAIFESYELTVAKGQDFRNTVATKTAATDDEITLTVPSAGAYVWKVVGITKANHRRLDAGTRGFNVDIPTAKPPPVLLAPNEGAHILAPEALSGVPLRWQAVKDAKSYSIKLDSFGPQGVAGAAEPFLDGKATTNEYRPRLKQAGLYQWAVRANFSESATPWSKARLLRVMAPKLVWGFDATHPAASHSEEPGIHVSWGKGGPRSGNWRVVYSRQENLTHAKTIAASKPEADLQMAEFGTYYARVESVDDDGHAQAVSDVVKLEIGGLLALPSPKLLVPAKGLQANARGDLLIKWRPVAKAVAYLVILRDEKGKVLFKSKTENTEAEAKNLLPGRLVLSIGSYNKNDELGPMQPLQNVEVPSQSAVAPPSEIHEFHIR